jgi:predicted nucleic acid-binding protein
VSTKPCVVIKDACILFDLIDLDLLETFYLLDVTPVTTGFVVSEVLDETQAALLAEDIKAGKLTIYNDGDVTKIAALSVEHTGLSFADCSVLELSFRVPGLILSADKSLRNEAKRRGLVVKGLLWVINQLFENEILSKEECLAKLEQYPLINPRTPKKDIQLLKDKINGL